MKMKLKKYQQGGMNPNDILASFLETLSEQEQDQFVDEFQELSPEEQLEVIQAISQQMQQPQMQQELPEYEDGGSPKNGDTKRATQKGKKMAVYMDGKWHNFGDSSMDDYRTHKSEKRKEAFYSRHKKNLQGDDSRSKAFRVYARKTWQEGGETPGVEIEVEGEETVKLPNGELQRFEGPKHSEGGIPTVLPEGAKIYSEHLKAPQEVVEVVLGKKTKKKYSYADLSKKFPTKPFEDKLQNPNLDKFEKQAAAIKLENHKTMLETIFDAQEMDKARSSKPQQMLTAQQGGQVEPLYPWFPENAPQGMTTPYGNYNPDIVPAFPISSEETFLRNRPGLGWSSFEDKPTPNSESLTPQQWAEMPAGQMQSKQPPSTKPPAKAQSTKSSKESKESKKPKYSIKQDEEFNKALTDYYNTGFIDIRNPNPEVPGGDLKDIPNLQNNRGRRVYGLEDWDSPEGMQDFKDRHIKFFSQPGNENWDPKKPGDTKKFQEWYDAENAKRGIPTYFTGKRDFDKVDDKFGQYTWSAPAISRTPEQMIELLGPKALPKEILSKNPKDWFRKPEENKEQDVADVPADDKDFPGKTPWWKDMGISRQLSGSIFDSLMAASNRLNVDEPQYRDNRKYPLFTRFVDFEDKEVSKQYNLSMQQIMNSNMPEQVKQSQIANLNAKLQDYQGKQDLQRNQLYQQKLMGDTEKLQGYMDRNIDQATADLENYRMKKARVEDLKNQFRAKRKADIVNPIRKYLDFVQEVDLENQVYSDNFKMNPWTGKVNFFKSTPDPLKKQEEMMNQFPSGSMSRNVEGGGREIVLSDGTRLYEDPSGKTIEIGARKQEEQYDDPKKIAANLMNRDLRGGSR